MKKSFMKFYGYLSFIKSPLTRIIILIIVLSSLNCAAFAQLNNYQNSDTSNTNVIEGSDWDTFVEKYDKNQIDNPITPQQYDKALETVQSMQKSKKDKKKKKGDVNVDKEKNKQIKEPETPVSLNPLLRLPFSVVFNNFYIKDGYYLIDYIKKDDKYYLVFKQGYNIVGEVDASRKDVSNYSPENKVTMEILNDKVKISYFEKLFVLEAYLYIYK